MATSAVLDELKARNLWQDSTDADSLRSHLDAGPVTLYHGIDPTADSLHIGHLIGVLVLRRFQDHGHVPLALVGGATGMVGDPGGRSEERNLLDDEALAANIAGIRAQLERLLDFSDDLMVNNIDWTGSLGLIEFLRDVGKHATVNQMMAKESVRARIEGEGGISFTEFSYMLLQANDFHWLHENRGCTLQIGGSDQWGNITMGIDMIRRRSGNEAHGLTWPLVTRADGRKFGKSVARSVWLSAERTSPYAFYQHWMQVPDGDVERYLLQLTLLPVDDALDVSGGHAADPASRTGQLRLARELTTLIHGPAAADAAAEASAVVFAKDADRPSEAALELLAAELPTSRFDSGRLGDAALVHDLMAEGEVTASKGEARRAIKGGAVSVNGARASEDAKLGADDLWYGRYALVRNGKKFHLLMFGR